MRLDIARQEALEPRRIKTCLAELERLRYTAEQVDSTEVVIYSSKGTVVRFWPYSGWYSGKHVGSGRGFHNMLRDIKRAPVKFR